MNSCSVVCFVVHSEVIIQHTEQVLCLLQATMHSSPQVFSLANFNNDELRSWRDGTTNEGKWITLRLFKELPLVEITYQEVTDSRMFHLGQ